VYSLHFSGIFFQKPYHSEEIEAAYFFALKITLVRLAVCPYISGVLLVFGCAHREVTKLAV